ncbi:hypothetical protein ACW73L_02390 [Methylolobus aquaticus]
MAGKRTAARQRGKAGNGIERRKNEDQTGLTERVDYTRREAMPTAPGAMLDTA